MTDLRTPLTPQEIGELRTGDWVRIELPAPGVVLQGPIERTGGLRMKVTEQALVNGVSLHLLGKVRVYSVPEGSEIINAAKIPVDENAVVEYLANAGESLSFMGRTSAVGLSDIIKELIGFDPAVSMSGRAYGGKSYEGYANQFLSVSELKKTLKRLCDEGKVIAVTDGTYADPSEHRRYVTFNGRAKSGWVAREAYDAAVAAVTVQERAQREEKLRAQARQIVADRHADEVENVLAELLAQG